jgi:hypothetical protein
LLHGAKPNVFRKVASRLGVDEGQVEGAIASTAKVFLEASRLRQSESDFVASLRETGLSMEVCHALWSAYNDSRVELEDAGARTASALPLLQGLEWRLEVEVASRTRRGEVALGGVSEDTASRFVPNYLLRLDTLAPAASASSAGVDDASSREVSSLYATCDYGTLKGLKATLEAAIGELNSGHAKRVQRYLR